MKKTAAMLVALLITSVSAMSQTFTSQAGKNVISISTSDNIPILAGSIISGGVIGAVTEAPVGQKLGDVDTRGCFTLGYSRYINPRFDVGGDLTYSGARINFENEAGRVVDKEDVNIFMVMATGKCRYVSKGIFTLGGDLGLGVMTDFRGATSMAFQIDPVDMRLGNDRVGGFLRVGFGVRGFFTLGLDVSL